MLVIKARNVNDALPEACHKLLLCKDEQDSRNGKVWKFPTPVTTWYTSPHEKVLFDADRDGNPFFHFFECLWMLAGRNDVETIAYFSSNIAQFSDDGETFNGAYGHRWRHHFGYDQLALIMQNLKANPDCRRQVLQMYDARHDSLIDSKDKPCNLDVMFEVNNGRLDILVANRSNDTIWGCYGANAVHFAFLQQFVAEYIGVKVGGYWQVSRNLHVYERHFELVEKLARKAPEPSSAYTPFNIYDGLEEQLPFHAESLWHELDTWMSEGPVLGMENSWLRRVALPLKRAYTLFKEEKAPMKYDRAIAQANACKAQDWRRACVEWLERRKAAWQAKQQQPQD